MKQPCPHQAVRCLELATDLIRLLFREVVALALLFGLAMPVLAGELVLLFGCPQQRLGAAHSLVGLGARLVADGVHEMGLNKIRKDIESIVTNVSINWIRMNGQAR